MTQQITQINQPNGETFYFKTPTLFFPESRKILNGKIEKTLSSEIDFELQEAILTVSREILKANGDSKIDWLI